MAELQQQEKLQPALLDRLTDDSPVAKAARSRVLGAAVPAADIVPSGPRNQAPSDGGNPDPVPSGPADSGSTRRGLPVHQSNPLIISSRRLKECVKRDLSWLLNTVNLESVVDLEPYPAVAQSVLNYGMPDLTGITVANIDTRALERKVTEIILKYEPRIIEKSLSVTISRKDEMSNRAIRFDIECDIWARPMPEHVRLNSELDLTTGAIAVADGPSG